MVEHDGHVGQVLDKLDKLGVADNTMVMYSTDNGAECFSWPDEEAHHSEMKEFELGRWLPRSLHDPLAWCGQTGFDYERHLFYEDMLPTILAAVGERTSRRSS